MPVTDSASPGFGWIGGLLLLLLLSLQQLLVYARRDVHPPMPAKVHPVLRTGQTGTRS
jgi:hypothetical protein